MSNEYRNKVIQGNNLEVLKQIPDNTFDSVVTDPPYGINFMNKKWDYDVPSVELWQEVFRVLKPGGHMLVACGTRTQHRMAANIEDAGFEIRDIVAWVYGSGFPKSMNVAKAISAYEKTGGSSPRNLRKDRQGEDYKPTSQKDYQKGRAFSSEIESDNRETNLTRNAKQWQGWGTALKPAMELWTLARKPIEEPTIAKNVIKYGTGGINIDESRIPLGKDEVKIGGFGNGGIGFGVGDAKGVEWQSKDEGRFPANFIHDGSEEVVKHFPYTKSGKMTSEHERHTDGSPNGICGKFDVNHPLSETYGDSGSASRFFYVAKASKKERNFGLDDFEEKQTTDGNIRSNQETARKFGANSALRKNYHPTVKPINLMRYLVKLVNPKGGIVLDLFAGSGSTLIGAKMESHDYFGIEYEEDYVNIINHRLKAWNPED